MKTNKCFLLLTVMVALFVSCGKDPVTSDAGGNNSKTKTGGAKEEVDEPSGGFDDNYTITAKKDNRRLDKDDNKESDKQRIFSARLRTLLRNLTIKNRLPHGDEKITEEQLAEIKQKADEIVAEAKAKTQRQKHDALLKWIRENVKYNGENGNVGSINLSSINQDANSAYNTFQSTKTGEAVAVCQGYANLLKMMCWTQGINAPVVNGFVYWGGSQGGHAWNYAHVDGRWIISDPTNKHAMTFDMNKPNEGNAKEYQPLRIDFLLGKSDELDCMYDDGEVSVVRVKKGASHIVKIPNTYVGFPISKFIPEYVEDGVTELQFGKNMKTFGEKDQKRFVSDSRVNAPDRNIAKVTFYENNSYLEEYKGVIYKKGTSEIVLIPKMLKIVHLKSGKKSYTKDDDVGIRYLKGLRVLHFGEGTTSLGNGCIKDCPNLEEVHLPRSVTSLPNNEQEIFDNCPNAKIIRK